MVRRTAAIGAAALAFTAIADAQQAAGQNAGEIARWTAAKVVHYHMVGVYDGSAVIAYREPAGQAIVTDRVGIDLDWDVKANAIVGEPTIVNAASDVRELRNEHASCPPPAPNGPYDHLTVKTLTPSGGALELKGSRASRLFGSSPAARASRSRARFVHGTRTSSSAWSSRRR